MGCDPIYDEKIDSITIERFKNHDGQIYPVVA